jgi:ABC-type branched-subunit amino acid transport system substrate-binding protein
MDRRVLNLLLCWLGASAGIRLSRAEAGQVLRIGLSLGLAGKYRELANMNKRGYEQWRDDVNARGGLLGHKIELTIEMTRATRAAQSTGI